MNHDAVQALLALSAAGILDAEGERTVREHVRECPECAAQLEALAVVSRGVSARPAPELPHALMIRTQGAIAAELAILAERRRTVRAACVAAAAAWTMNVATWAAIHWWQPGIPGPILWLGLSVLTACSAAPAAALMARRTRRRSWGVGDGRSL